MRAPGAELDSKNGILDEDELAATGSDQFVIFNREASSRPVPRRPVQNRFGRLQGRLLLKRF